MIKRIYLFLTVCAIAGCTTGIFNMGEEMIDIETKALLVDSFTVKMSTFKIDSLETNGARVALVGQLQNNAIGSIEMRHYFNIDMSSGILGLQSGDDRDVFDSLTVRLKYSRYSVGDTLQPMTISLHRLEEGQQLQLITVGSVNPAGNLYNITEFPVEAEPLGTSYSYRKDFRPEPIGKDTVEFRLNDEFGIEIMEKFLNKDNDVESNALFNRYIRGFMLKADANSKAIIGFRTDTIMLKLYTHRLDLYNTRKSYEFMVAAENTNYNQVITDRTGTDFVELDNRMQYDEIFSTETGDRTYIQSGSGIITRIEFPTINHIFQQFLSPFKAHLQLYVQTGSNANEGISTYWMNQLPDSLFLFASGQANIIQNQLVTQSGPVVARLVRDAQKPENSFYFADISHFLIEQELLQGFYDTSIGLLITPSTISTNRGLYNSADFVIFRGEKTDNYALRPRLNLYVLSYDQEQ